MGCSWFGSITSHLQLVTFHLLLISVQLLCPLSSVLALLLSFCSRAHSHPSPSLALSCSLSLSPPVRSHSLPMFFEVICIAAFISFVGSMISRNLSSQSPPSRSLTNSLSLDEELTAEVLRRFTNSSTIALPPPLHSRLHPLSSKSSRNLRRSSRRGGGGGGGESSQPSSSSSSSSFPRPTSSLSSSSDSEDDELSLSDSMYQITHYDYLQQASSNPLYSSPAASPLHLHSTFPPPVNVSVVDPSSFTSAPGSTPLTFAFAALPSPLTSSTSTTLENIAIPLGHSHSPSLKRSCFQTTEDSPEKELPADSQEPSILPGHENSIPPLEVASSPDLVAAHSEALSSPTPLPPSSSGTEVPSIVYISPHKSQPTHLEATVTSSSSSFPGTFPSSSSSSFQQIRDGSLGILPTSPPNFPSFKEEEGRDFQPLPGDTLSMFIIILMILCLSNTAVLGLPLVRSLYGTEYEIIPAVVTSVDMVIVFPLLFALMELRRQLQLQETTSSSGSFASFSRSSLFPPSIANSSTTRSSTPLLPFVRRPSNNSSSGSLTVPTSPSTPPTSPELPVSPSLSIPPTLSSSAFFSRSSSSETFRRNNNDDNSPPSEESNTFGSGLTKIVLLRTLQNPLLIAVVAGTLYSLSDLPFFTILDQAALILGNCLYGVALLALGIFIGSRSLLFLLRRPKSEMAGLFVLRIVIAPLVMLALEVGLFIQGQEGTSLIGRRKMMTPTPVISLLFVPFILLPLACDFFSDNFSKHHRKTRSRDSCIDDCSSLCSLLL
jgi:predicted permease